MDPVASFTCESFRPYVGQRFEVADPSVELVLATTVPKGQGARDGGAFSVYFHGPAEPLLPQATYELSHADAGEFAVFLVPVGRTVDGYEYEAAFS